MLNLNEYLETLSFSGLLSLSKESELGTTYTVRGLISTYQIANSLSTGLAILRNALLLELTQRFMSNKHILEQRVVTQHWYETECSRTGWDSHGWAFMDSGETMTNDWTIRKHIKIDKFGNPFLGIAERIVVL
jgi:hypothetical protein